MQLKLLKTCNIQSVLKVQGMRFSFSFLEWLCKAFFKKTVFYKYPSNARRGYSTPLQLLFIIYNYIILIWGGCSTISYLKSWFWCHYDIVRYLLKTLKNPQELNFFLNSIYQMFSAARINFITFAFVYILFWKYMLGMWFMPGNTRSMNRL